MYVTDKSFMNNDKQLILKQDNTKLKTEKFNLKQLCYKSNDQFEKELFLIKQEEHRQINPIIYENVIHYISNPYKTKNMYEEDSYTVKQYGDIEFISWLKTQNDPKLAIFAELVNAPRLHLNIEKERPNIDNIKTISISEYVKLKKWGSKQMDFLKELKHKYGNNILKFLYLTIQH
jgi:hypothetical protein